MLIMVVEFGSIILRQSALGRFGSSTIAQMSSIMYATTPPALVLVYVKGDEIYSPEFDQSLWRYRRTGKNPPVSRLPNSQPTIFPAHHLLV